MFNRFNFVSARHDVADNRDGVFKKRFLCRVMQKDIRSIDDIQKHGSPVSGYSPVDDAMTQEWVERLWPVVHMASHYGKGYNIRIVKYTDTKLIYDNVQAHLMSWRERVQTSFNPGNIPIEDLLTLDKFANAVYDKAKYFFESKTDDPFLNLISQFNGGFTADDILNAFQVKRPEHVAQENAMTEQEKIDAQFPARVSMSDLFQSSFKR